MSDAPRRWAVLLPRASAAAAASLRLSSTKIEIRDHGDALLLRGSTLDESLDNLLRQIPGAERFTISDEGAMFPIGSRIPRGTLPSDNWSPIATWLALDPQPAAAPARIGKRVSLRMARTNVEDVPNILVTTLAHWTTYASTAPAVRLKPLRFAASEYGHVVLRGSPLPPIPGTRCVERDGIVTPCGFAFVPNVEPAILRLSLDLLEGELALFSADASYDVIPADAFVNATRSAAKQSLASSRRAE